MATKMTSFYLIRHGAKQADNTMIGRMSGVHLTAGGRKQARAIARLLRDVPLAAYFSSPLERTIETLEPLVRARRMEIQIHPAFHEIEMGEWTGLSMTRLARLPEWKQFCRFPAGTPIPGGETLAEAQARVVSEMIRLRHRYPHEGIAIATHEDPIRLAVCYFIGAPIEVYENITVRLGSVTLLRVDENRAVLDRVDEIPSRHRARHSA